MQKESVTISCGAAAPQNWVWFVSVVCLVWCVCATGGGPQYCKMYWFPYGLLAVTEKPDAPAPRDKTR